MLYISYIVYIHVIYSAVETYLIVLIDSLSKLMHVSDLTFTVTIEYLYTN